MNIAVPSTARYSLLMLVSALCISGCSGSSDSSSLAQDDLGVVNDSSVQIETDDAQNTNETESILADDTMFEEPDVVDTGLSQEDSATPDPLIQNTTQVSFEITVPAFQSNELRIELSWGDIHLTAMWVGDEFWSASGEFPTNTQNFLTVTFYDLNGDMELARFSQDYTTGFNTAELKNITADQFDADVFDTDADGVNNLDESIAGTDPLIDEESLATIYDTVNHSRWSRMSVSRHFESNITDARPYINTISINENPAFGSYTDANIDEEGNGSLTYNQYTGSSSLRITGTRTASDNSVSWEGSRIAHNDYTHSVSVSNTVTYIDATTRGFVEESEGSNVGAYSDVWESRSNLIGRVIDGTSLCEPIAGTFTTTYSSNRNGGENYTLIYSKGIDDLYWRLGGSESSYFAREMIVLRSYCGTSCGSHTLPEPEDKYFTCDFVDF